MLKPGTKVQLASGGYVMTVHYVVTAVAKKYTDLDMGVHCDWHDSSGNPHRAVYMPEQLVILDDK